MVTNDGGSCLKFFKIILF